MSEKKTTKAEKVNATTLFAQIESIGQQATQAIDALLEQQQELKVDAELKKDLIDAELELKLAPLNDQIKKLDELYNRTTGRWYITPAKPAKVKTAGDGTRTRKSKEQLLADAQAIHSFVLAKGKAGATAKELIAKYGKVSLPPMAFVEKYGDGLKLKKTGNKVDAVYFAE